MSDASELPSEAAAPTAPEPALVPGITRSTAVFYEGNGIRANAVAPARWPPTRAGLTTTPGAWSSAAGLGTWPP